MILGGVKPGPEHCDTPPTPGSVRQDWSQASRCVEISTSVGNPMGDGAVGWVQKTGLPPVTPMTVPLT